MRWDQVVVLAVTLILISLILFLGWFGCGCGGGTRIEYRGGPMPTPGFVT